MIQLLTILQLPDEENRNFCNYSLGLVVQNCHKSIDMGIADKLKRTLNGQEEEEEDVGILTTVCHPSKRDSCFLPSCYSSPVIAEAASCFPLFFMPPLAIPAIVVAVVRLCRN